MEQPTELALILAKLDSLSDMVSTVGRRIDKLDAGMTFMMKQWKRLGTKTAELDDDVQELSAMLPRETPAPWSP